jgi:2,5-diketo-D-gluconate reductase A
MTMTQHEPAVPPDALDLPGGGRIPLLGFGTWQLTGAAASTAVSAALAAGYRHLDTATMYRNEAEVGAALREAGVAREEVFLTTKLPPDRTGQARATLEASLEGLGVDRVDLWLIHWPPDTGAGVDVWEQLLSAQQDGLAVDVGVSNYSLAQIDELTAATGTAPAVNQIEWSPLRFDAGLLAGHRERHVVLEGYSGLRGGVLEHPVVLGIAERLGRTPAQVVIRWHLEHSTVVIPKSGRPERVAANAAVGDFTLSASDVAALDALG